MSERSAGGLRFDPEDPVLARVAWSRICEPGDADAYQLVAAAGPVAALRAALNGTAGCRRWRVRLPDADPVRDLATLGRFGGRLLVPGAPEWPAALDDLGAWAPFCLWVRGPLQAAAACRRSVAVVGSRAATGYGEHLAALIGAGCAERGFTVVSGAAYGIDGAAHRGSLSGGGPTLAVLACGVDRSYPRGHERLIERIAADGLVLSEVPPGSAPTRWRFVERNRLIAAMSRATVVVEATWRSGALVTAHRAGELGRPVGAVPGLVTAPTSAGCHRLLREGVATCVTDAAEVVELAAPIGEFLDPAAPDGEFRLPPDDRRVLDSLPVRRAAALASLSRVAGLEQATVASALGRLELQGLAVREPAGWRRDRSRGGA